MNEQYGYKTYLGLDFTSTKRHKTLRYYILNKTKLNKFTIVPYKIPNIQIYYLIRFNQIL